MRPPSCALGVGASPWLLLPLLAALGCGGPPPPPAPPPFSCEAAAASLGRPDAHVEGCAPLVAIDGWYELSLREGDGPKEHVAVEVHDGRPTVVPADPGRLATVLRGLTADQRAALRIGDVSALIRAFEAFPPRFGPRDWNFDLPDVGRSTFVPDPFEIVLYVQIPPSPEHPTDPPAYGRARLRLLGDPLAWEVSERKADGTWTDPVELPLVSPG